MLLGELVEREQAGQPIQVGLIGAGAMGKGIALQIGKTPGMELSFIADTDPQAANVAKGAYGKDVATYNDASRALDDEKIPLDVLVEATNSIGPAAGYSLEAIARGAHVVLMNAEVDLVVGPLLQHKASEQDVIVTSDAGDQHGVLARMIDEIALWGFDITQAGNIKGFLDRYATAASKAEIAKQLGLSITQCVAYTDGTKLNVEMALIGNGANLTPTQDGMEGPRAENVSEALTLFNFDTYGDQGKIDYLLGAQPGGGVYVIGSNNDPVQAEYLDYYKVQNKEGRYLFYRPYHLCHIETPRAIARAALWGKAVLQPRHGQLNDAKQDLNTGALITHGIGGDQTYGLVSENTSDLSDRLPVGLLESESGSTEHARTRRKIAKDEPLYWGDIEIPQTKLLDLYQRQSELLNPR
ncbi:MAG TPA: hypothetical protein VLE73_04765 [Candidatus Saccharimonadales bacterium]|nr:hypothetical protein [Candidatus Saccharimonadales bacterium]